MKNCRIVTLYSGSDGNAVYVQIGKTSILIDAGKNARTLCRSLCDIGADADALSAIFITHEHGDHVSALEVFCKHHAIPVHVMEASASRFDRLPATVFQERLVRHAGMFTETVGDMTVSSFRTPHDSRMSVGYRISFSDGDGIHTVGIATDMGYVSDSVREGLTGCEAVVLESNHDLDMLMEGQYPDVLKKRIASRWGHLSNADCAAFAAELAQNGTKAFLLAHLSRENNEPRLAWHETTEAIADPTVTVAVAEADCPTELPLS